MIGAGSVADLAARLEAAADEGRSSDVEAEHQTLLDAYARTADALARALKAAGITVDETDIPDDVEVFEFGGEDDDIVFEFLPDNE